MSTIDDIALDLKDLMPDENLREKLLVEFEEIIGAPLLVLAEDPQKLLEALHQIDFEPHVIPLNYAGLGVDNEPEEVNEARLDVFIYLLALFALYKLNGLPIPENAEKMSDIYSLVPQLGQDFIKEDILLRRWIIRRQSLVQVPNEHLQSLFAVLGLENV